MNKLAFTSLVLLLAGETLYSGIYHPNSRRIVYHDDHSFEHRNVVSPLIVRSKFALTAPRRTFFYRPSPTIIYNTQPVVLTTSQNSRSYPPMPA